MFPSYARTSKAHGQDVATLLRHSPAVLTANVVGALVIVAGAAGWPLRLDGFAWLVGVLVLTAARARLYWSWRGDRAGTLDRTRWLYGAPASLASGILWGAAPWVFITDATSVQSLLVAFVIGGMVAGAAGTLSCHFSAFIAFSLPAVLPLGLRYAFDGSSQGWLMAAMTLLFAVLMSIVARNVHCAVGEALSLKADLVAEQRRARWDLEAINSELDARVKERTRRLDAYARRERSAADLGCLALEEDSISHLSARASGAVRGALAIDVFALYELLPDGRTLGLRGADGDLPERVARLDVTSETYVVDTERPEHSALALQTLHELVISTDGDLGRRHVDDVLCAALDVTSFVSVALVGKKGPLGVLFVGSRAPRIFGRDDTSYVQIIANVVAGAIARRRLDMVRRQSQQLIAMGRLASGVAHEINTPIQFIEHSAAFLQTAVRDLQMVYEEHAALVDSLSDRPELSARIGWLAELRSTMRLDYITGRIPESLDRIQLGVGRVAETIRALRPLGAIRSSSAETDVNELLKSAAIITNHLTKPVADVKLDLGPVPRISAHPGELLQVLQGLIINAADAIEARADGRRGTIVLRSLRQGPTVVVEVEDDGSGIPEAECPRIFEAHRTTKSPDRGMGQGLAIAQDIVERGHRGCISVWSEVGQGSTFRIEIPMDLQDPISWRSVVMERAGERKCS